MDRIQITVRGEVQRVGYRDRVQRIARKNAITGWVQNIRGYDVQIVAEGTCEDLNTFCREIQIIEGPIHVESLDIVHVQFTGEFEYFEIKRGQPDEEMGERFDAALHYLIRIDANSQRSVEIGELMLQKQDVMLEKQDQMIGNQDRMLEKQDTINRLQQDTINEIHHMNHEVVHTLESRYVTIEHQLDEIRIALKKAGILT